MSFANWTDLASAATQLGVSYVTVRNWVITGKLRGERLHGRWIVDADHVTTLARQRRRAPNKTKERNAS